MSSILLMRRMLSHRPLAGPICAVQVRHYRAAGDSRAWLALREAAFAAEMPAVRPWTEADFQRELLEKPWWEAERMLLARETQAPRAGELLGAAILAQRGSDQHAQAVIHWLMVAPSCRRRGVGRLLAGRLEQMAWDRGFREVHLETHARWAAAVNFYRALGYQAIR